jgi:hypothetical protein
MWAAKAVFVIWLLSALALWVRSGTTFSILETLPFVERRIALPPDYDWAALAVLATGVWGMVKITGTPPPSSSSTPKPISTAVLILVPIAVVVLALLTARVTLAVGFADVVGQPRDLLKYQCLTILALGVIAALLAVKWFRSR